MTQSAAKAAADEALRAAGEDNLRDESPPDGLLPNKTDTQLYIMTPHLGGEGMEMMALHTKVCGAALF